MGRDVSRLLSERWGRGSGAVSWCEYQGWCLALKKRDWVLESGELEAVWADWGHGRGGQGPLAALAAGWKIVNSPRMLFACTRPGEAAQVLGERQPAPEQGRASS